MFKTWIRKKHLKAITERVRTWIKIKINIIKQIFTIKEIRRNRKIVINIKKKRSNLIKMKRLKLLLIERKII